jgi:hypothetical protein
MVRLNWLSAQGGKDEQGLFVFPKRVEAHIDDPDTKDAATRTVLLGAASLDAITKLAAAVFKSKAVADVPTSWTLQVRRDVADPNVHVDYQAPGRFGVVKGDSGTLTDSVLSVLVTTILDEAAATLTVDLKEPVTVAVLTAPTDLDGVADKHRAPEGVWEV